MGGPILEDQVQKRVRRSDVPFNSGRIETKGNRMSSFNLGRRETRNGGREDQSLIGSASTLSNHGATNIDRRVAKEEGARDQPGQEEIGQGEEGGDSRKKN